MSSGLTRPTNLSSDWFLHGARCLSSCKLSYTFHVCHVPKPGYVSFRFQLVYPLIRPNRAQYKQKLSAASDSNNYQPVFPEDFLPPKLNHTSALQTAVLISDIEMSPGVLQSYPLFCRHAHCKAFTYTQSGALILQPSKPCSITSSMFSELVLIYFFPMSQL